MNFGHHKSYNWSHLKQKLQLFISVMYSYSNVTISVNLKVTCNGVGQTGYCGDGVDGHSTLCITRHDVTCFFTRKHILFWQKSNCSIRTILNSQTPNVMTPGDYTYLSWWTTYYYVVIFHFRSDWGRSFATGLTVTWKRSAALRLMCPKQTYMPR